MRVRPYEKDESATASGAAGLQPAGAERRNNRRAESPSLHQDDNTTTAPAPNTETSPAARAREARYRELLEAPPPDSAVAPLRDRPTTSQPSTPPPTLADRPVKPIAGGLGLNRPANPPQAMAQPKRPPQEPPATKEPPANTDPNAERDEDSDVTPPRLLGVEFVPPQVQDGEQTTFSAVVTDDISGVKSVSGVIVGPSGAQQGFASQRDETGRFLSRITVPKEAAEGWWAVKYLTLSDNAGNNVNLMAGQGLPATAGFRVSSPASDSKGPTLKAVWLEQASMSAGEKNTVLVQAEDDKSGVNLVSGVFISPSKSARIGFGCRLMSESGQWQCPVSPPTCVDCGSWQLEQIQLQDKANNMTTVRPDNPLVANVHLDLYGKECDKTPPVITALSLDPQVVSNAEGGVVRVTATATDNQCGVASLSGVAMPQAASNTRYYFPFRPVEGDIFQGEIQIPKNAPSGVYVIGWIQALDKGHNLQSYSSNDPVIARVTFRVE